MIPFAVPEPFDVMLRKVKPLAPIVVLATLSAVPVVVVNVLTMVLLFCVALTVPPPVAVNAALVVVLRASPPVKLIVAPVLLLRRTPVPVSLIAWLKVVVPPVRDATFTERPAVVVIGALIATVPLAAPVSETAPPLVPELPSVTSLVVALPIVTPLIEVPVMANLPAPPVFVT